MHCPSLLLWQLCGLVHDVQSGILLALLGRRQTIADNTGADWWLAGMELGHEHVVIWS